MKKLGLIILIAISTIINAQETNTSATKIEEKPTQNVDKLDMLDQQSKEFFKSITGLEKSYLEEQIQELKNKKEEADKGIIQTNVPQNSSNTQGQVIMTEEEYEKNVFNHQNEIARITTDFARTKKIKDLKIKSMYTFNGVDYAVLLLDDTESASRNKTSTELSGNIEGRYVEGDNILGLKIIDINTRTKSIELYKKLDEDTGYTIFLSNYGINVSNLEKRDKNDPRYTQNAPKNISKKNAIYSDNTTSETTKNTEKIEVLNDNEQKNNLSVKKAFEDVKPIQNKSNSNKLCYIVNKQNLNVRIEPNDSSKILRVLKINDKFVVQKSNQDWLNIDTIYKKVSGDVMNVSDQSNWVQNTDESLTQIECN
ncbi:hypothetical protein [Aliarcobacter cibarius]|uniref:hypothetical protein n=1 Tax=Aliarcobacter cibarius TaxID=255507 RepID=UPI0010FDB9A5|nr:hypothetical protein [Aliarcobacter cibarius]TLT05245.1 hypothetical protein FE248_00710 [Aliarcobacter cibarius]